MTIATPDLAPTRAAVLRAAAAEQIWEDWCDEEFGLPGDAWQQVTSGRDTKVTATVRWLKDAGWCETSTDDADLHFRRIVPTEVGRRWIAEHP